MAQVRHVLISSFDPFNRAPVNNSTEVAQGVKAALLAQDPHLKIHLCLLPTIFDRAAQLLDECYRQLPEPPVAVFSLGEGNCTVKLETMGHNIDHNPSGADNAGNLRRRRTIISGAPARVGMRLDLAGMWCKLTSEEKKMTNVSTTPGNFVCNNTAFRFAHEHPELMYGFIHIPKHQCSNNSQNIPKAISIVTKLVQAQLELLNGPERSPYPSPYNSAHLFTEKSDVKALLRQGDHSSCEEDFLKQWIKAF